MKQTAGQKEKVITHIEVEVEGYTYLVTIRISKEKPVQYTADWFCPKTKQECELGYYLGNCFEVERDAEREIRKRHCPASQAA